jgi:ppGpp synthetase/RelA/SpoT-type nucleotidyltranferase
VIVDDLAAQDRAIAALKKDFPDARVIDRRQQPSHGYRAVHVIVRSHEKLVEVQVRTALQHLWAELPKSFRTRLNPQSSTAAGPSQLAANLQRSPRLLPK